MYYCLGHDYAYYPESWQADNGTVYKAGYYDENGNYYQNIKVENSKEDLPMLLTCEYCGTEVKVKWTEGTVPNCSNCGAPLSMKGVQTDRAVASAAGSSANYNAGGQNAGQKKKKRPILTILATILGISIVSSCVNSGISSDKTSSEDTLPVYESSDSASQYAEQAAADILYLSETGDGIYEYASAGSFDKALEWSSSDEAYFDAETGFWLWCNDSVTPEVWQYWIEGVSDRYGDYGWMECEGDDWYVEVAYGDWQLYDGDTSWFWHIRNSFD